MTDAKTPSPENGSISILIVDNEEWMRLSHKRQIKRAESKKPIQIFEASSISEAQQILSKRAIDLMLLDHNLGEDEKGNEHLGVEAIPSFLKIQRALRIIVVTGNNGEALKRRALEFGAANFVVKGNSDLVKEAIVAALESVEKRIPHGMVASSHSEISAHPEAIYLHHLYNQLRNAREAGTIREILFSNRSMRADDASEGYFFEAVSRSGVGSAFSADYYIKDHGVIAEARFISEHMNNVSSSEPDLVAQLLTSACNSSLGENSLFARLLSSALQSANVTSFGFPYSLQSIAREGTFYVFSLEHESLIQTEWDYKKCVERFGEKNRRNVQGMQIRIHECDPKKIVFNFETASYFVSEKFQPHKPAESSSGVGGALVETDNGIVCNVGFAPSLEAYAKSRPESLKLLWTLVSAAFPKGTPFSFEFREEQGRDAVKLTLGGELPLAEIIAAVEGSAAEAGIPLD